LVYEFDEDFKIQKKYFLTKDENLLKEKIKEIKEQSKIKN
jgi:hypothetical protein